MHVEGVRTHFFDQLDVEHLEELRRISERVLKHMVAVKGLSPRNLDGSACPSSHAASASVLK